MKRLGILTAILLSLANCSAGQKNPTQDDSATQEQKILMTLKAIGTDFNIQFPTTPTTDGTVGDLQGIGKVELVSMSAEGAMLTYNSMPPENLKNIQEVNQFYDGKIAFILMDLGISPDNTDIKVEYKEVLLEHGDYAGKEFSVSTPDGKEVLVGRTLLDDNTAYFMMAFANGDGSKPREFTDSFELIK